MSSPELQLLKSTSIMPVVVLDSSEQAVPLAEALLKGGVSVMEITLRSDVALAAIGKIAKELPEITVGAGTVLDATQLRMVKDHGAQFVISPGISLELLETSESIDMPFVPGVATASEVMLGLSQGKHCFKLFPADAVGGLKLLKALGGPFPNVSFCPTGGISQANMADYLRLRNVECVGGSWVCAPNLLAEKAWGEITVLAKAAVELSAEASNSEG